MVDTEEDLENPCEGCDISDCSQRGQFASYKAWSSMIQRCYNPNDPAYKNWGGKGVKVCDRWRYSYSKYKEDMGPKPEGVSKSGRSLYSVNRIDNDGNYEPPNCEWSTNKEQARNRSNSVWTEHEGRRITADELSEITGVAVKLIYYRIKQGLSGEDLLKPAHVPTVEIEGTVYNLDELSEKHGISKNIIRDRVRSGREKTFEEVMNPRRLTDHMSFYEFQGENLTLPEIARRTGILEETLRQRARVGDSGQNLVRPVPQKNQFEYQGRSYLIPELSRVTGIPETTLHRNLDKTNPNVNEIITRLLQKKKSLT